MKGKIITGIICGGIGVFAGYKLTVNKVMSLLNSDELKQELSQSLENEMVKNKKNNDIIFESRDEANEVSAKLFDLIDHFGYLQ